MKGDGKGRDEPADRHSGDAAPAPPPRHGSWYRWAAWFVLSAMLLITAGLWHFIREETTKRVQERFDFRVREVDGKIRERLLAYERILRGGAGLFQASDAVDRDGWRAFVQALKVEQAYPGIQGLGFSQRILPAEREAHIRRVRAEGFPAYDLRPEGERPEYTSIVYLEPFDWRNQRAFGFDMLTEPVRAEAMKRARDTGLPSMSGKVTLVQETDKDRQAGFLLYLPIYRNGTSTATQEQRREALAGYVYSPFRMNDFMRGIIAEGKRHLELRIFDGGTPPTLLYEDRAGEGPDSHFDRSHFATSRIALDFGGHRWLLEFSSSPHFEEDIETVKANAFLGSGILASALLFGMFIFLARSREQAIVLADLAIDMKTANSQLHNEIESRRAAEEVLRERALDLEAFNEAMVGRESRVMELKEEVNKLCAEQGREPRYPPVWRDTGTIADGAGQK